MPSAAANYSGESKSSIIKKMGLYLNKPPFERRGSKYKYFISKDLYVRNNCFGC
jgi:hypothetical protein